MRTMPPTIDTDLVNQEWFMRQLQEGRFYQENDIASFAQPAIRSSQGFPYMPSSAAMCIMQYGKVDTLVGPAGTRMVVIGRLEGLTLVADSFLNEVTLYSDEKTNHFENFNTV